MTITCTPLIAQQTRAKPIRDGSTSSATIDMSMKAAIRKDPPSVRVDQNAGRTTEAARLRTALVTTWG